MLSRHFHSKANAGEILVAKEGVVLDICKSGKSF